MRRVGMPNEDRADGFIQNFESRATYNSEAVSFLWRDARPIYIMDNHLAAAWCWSRHLHPTVEYNFLHVDAHYDLDCNEIDTRVVALTSPISDLTFEEYRSLR